MESGIEEVNIGGKLMDPKIVMASRKRNVAPTILGNLAAWMGEACTGDVDGFFVVGVLITGLFPVGRP